MVCGISTHRRNQIGPVLHSLPTLKTGHCESSNATASGCRIEVSSACQRHSGSLRSLVPKSLAREAAAEFLGTFVLIVFGVGVVAQVVLSGGAAGGILSIHIGWGLAVAMGVYIAGGISGAHLNPAVTLALAVRGRFP